MISAALRRFALLCCSLALLALAGVARADDAPTFSDPDVTAFVKEYGALIDQYAGIMKDYMAAVRANDTARYTADITKSQECMPKMMDLQKKALTFDEKLKPDETQKFSDFMKSCEKKMDDATK